MTSGGDLPAEIAKPFWRQPGLSGLFADWSERAPFREELALKARDTPHLIRDIGLTMADVREELAKPFWRR